MHPIQVASTIDHTLLKPEAGINQIRSLCNEAVEYGFHSVCVNPIWVSEVSNFLKKYDIEICTVVGFPLGSISTSNKLHEMDTCIQNGATEIDMVMNIGYFKDGKLQYVSNEISKMVQNNSSTIIKVIIETSLLNYNEIQTASKLVEDCGAHFVKTSTGFSSFGATPENIELIKKSLKSNTQIKASGGIKNLRQVNDLIIAGANRIGTSCGVIIMKEISGN